MDNKILLERLEKLPGLKLNKHTNSELINGECVTRKPSHRHRNVIGDINPTGSSFILYYNGKWTSKNNLGIRTMEEAIDWVQKDIDRLSK